MNLTIVWPILPRVVNFTIADKRSQLTPASSCFSEGSMESNAFYELEMLKHSDMTQRTLSNYDFITNENVRI